MIIGAIVGGMVHSRRVRSIEGECVSKVVQVQALLLLRESPGQRGIVYKSRNGEDCCAQFFCSFWFNLNNVFICYDAIDTKILLSLILIPLRRLIL